jgi:predicted DNA-binding transcriptional regulator AlpA
MEAIMNRISLPKDVQFMSKKAVAKMIGYSVSQLQRLENAGKFPKAIKFGPGKSVHYINDVEDWVNSKCSNQHDNSKQAGDQP